MAQGKNCSKQDLDQVVALSMMDVKGMDEDTVTWMRAIEALPVVSLLSLLTKKSGFCVTLRCYESCGEKMCGLVCISKTRTTLLACSSFFTRPWIIMARSALLPPSLQMLSHQTLRRVVRQRWQALLPT